MIIAEVHIITSGELFSLFFFKFHFLPKYRMSNSELVFEDAISNLRSILGDNRKFLENEEKIIAKHAKKIS